MNSYPATGGNSKTVILRPMSVLVTHAKWKSNYSRCQYWSSCHCKHRKRPLENVYMDFVTIPNLKGKHYMDSFSRHLIFIACIKNCAFDAVRTLYSFFLCHQEIPLHRILWLLNVFIEKSTKEVWKSMSITREIHCHCWPQSLSNIEQQHHTVKNAFYMLFEEYVFHDEYHYQQSNEYFATLLSTPQHWITKIAP